MTHVVVVGAGQAGLALAARLRADGFDGQITLIGAEPHPPYQRPPLSKDYLLGELQRERLYLRPESFYAEQGIDLRMGAEVAFIDTGRREVSLVTGGVVPYDELVLTTGSTPRRLPAAIGGDLDGVLVMRDTRDADRLAPELAEGKRVLVVGGGYIGLEAAAVCAKRGLAGEDGHVRGAVLSTGEEIPVDLVLVGVGVVPNTKLAESAGIEVENGIKTDEYGRTSAPHVWAAGDCASLPHGEGRIRLESVGNAIDQAEAVARNIMGANAPYVPQPWFWSDQYDTKLQIAGLNTGYDRVFVREIGAGLSHWYYCGDRLVAVDAMNDSRAYMIGKRLLEAGKSPAPEVVIDPATDLKALLKA